jgi:hypothetical protein
MFVYLIYILVYFVLLRDINTHQLIYSYTVKTFVESAFVQDDLLKIKLLKHVEKFVSIKVTHYQRVDIL